MFSFLLAKHAANLLFTLHHLGSTSFYALKLGFFMILDGNWQQTKAPRWEYNYWKTNKKLWWKFTGSFAGSFQLIINNWPRPLICDKTIKTSKPSFYEASTVLCSITKARLGAVKYHKSCRTAKLTVFFNLCAHFRGFRFKISVTWIWFLLRRNLKTNRVSTSQSH